MDISQLDGWLAPIPLKGYPLEGACLRCDFRWGMLKGVDPRTDTSLEVLKAFFAAKCIVSESGDPLTCKDIDNLPPLQLGALVEMLVDVCIRGGVTFDEEEKKPGK